MRISSIILPIALLLYTTGTRAQPVAGLPGHSNLTVVYNISISSNKKSTGIAETYNGGIKTVMLQGSKARVRLVSLMRIQSHYFFKHDSTLAKVLITKESGKKKYKYHLSASDWKLYNTRYDSLSITLFDEPKLIAGYNCKKAIITVPGQNKEIIIYYTPDLNPLDKHIEPLFAGIPGMVLQYVTENENGSISFTADKISFEPFAENLLQEPTTGYVQKNYTASDK